MSGAAPALGMPAAKDRMDGAHDWGRRIRERLAGSAPRHEPEQWLLPGLTAEQSREYREYFPVHPIAAAVLVPIIEHDPQPTVLLTERATRLRNHPGQVSFPGGRIEPQDASPRAAALREAHEEIGLDPARVEVVGYLPDHVVISGFRVTPVVGFVRPGFALRLDAQEVADTFEVPLSFIFEPANHRARLRRFAGGESEVELCDIPYGERNIWGATAGMLLTLYRLCTEDPRP
ncbi:MAG TPA: CoA pyrophosphatase [Steroidobacteraceae bacterium]|nr:CoA pyrophosphatase [Steroidobacteraceae bacterium]